MATIFTPVETKRAYDIVYEQIENMILSGKLKPGDKLPSERDLMNIYKRSHPTIREALRMLEASNYIRVIPGGCAEICYSSTENIQASINELLQFRQIPLTDIYQFIRLSEAEFIEQAVHHFTWEDLVALESIYTEMQEATDQKLVYTMKMFSFHLELMKSTHNPLIFVIWNCMGEFWSPDKISIYEHSIFIEDIEKLQDSHRQLITAIKEKNATAAANLIRCCWTNWQLIESSKEGL